MDKEQYSNYKDKEQEELEKARKITVDTVNPNEQQPEVDHNIQMKQSQSGYLNLVHSGWRDCRGDGFFSYDMKVDPEQYMYLLVTYFGSDATLHVDGKSYQRDFDILIDGEVIASQQLHANKPGALFDVCYEIPAHLMINKEKVEVRFKSEEGKAAGGVYGVRILNERATFH
ncbi:DUF6805 domain-containing protein [Aquibacillus sediminis]|uniref:DUF6805 domain-containing protein n=1 Tax=Aquibacillus sediminis TaxID=2574734 RepID=UPI0011096AC0|nr:DUF6805 domain-containing protein [Aquibacillus sediminis]